MHTLFTVIIISLLVAGGGQLRSATLAWCRQTFRACAMTSVTSPSSSSAPMTTTGSTRAVSSLTWRMTRTLSRVRSTSTKHLRKVTFSRESPSLSFCHRRNNTLTLRFWCLSALEEAARRFQELKAQRESREALEQERNSRKPPPYKFIKVT